MNQKRAVVTGGAGFIGSHIVDALVKQGHEVVVIDDLSSGKKENLPSGVELLEADIRASEAADKMATFKPQVLFHLAAQLDVRKSVYDPSFDADINIRGALNLLEAGRKAGLEQVVFSSTGGAIYGEQNQYPADEDHAEWPMSPYGITKLALEKYLFYYNNAYGLNAVCLRYSNVYGPRQNAHGEAGVVAIFTRKLLSGEQPTIFGDGQNTRDFVYVGDVVKANMASIGVKGYHIYNVGTGVESTVNGIYGILKRLTGSSHDAHYGDPLPGEQRRSCITAKKIESAFNINLDANLDDGLEKTVEWFKQNS